MPIVPLQNTSLVLLALSLIFTLAAFSLARAYLVQVIKLSSGQTPALVRTILRVPVPERLSELKRRAEPQSIAWRIADEALLVSEPQRASAVDSVLAEVALDLEARSMWPRAAVRISGASGVLLMAVAISLRVEMFVPVVLLIVGIFGAIVCLMAQRQAKMQADEIRRTVDALIDALQLRGLPDVRRRSADEARNERRSRRRRAAP